MVLAIVIGTMGGGVASALGVPLPWMLGPFLACAGASIAGLRLMGLPRGREVGQVVVGLAIGMRMTAAALATTLALLPAMFFGTLFIIVMTMLAALLLMPLARVDARTAFFATAAAGMADMATVAQQRGGDPDVVSLMHAIRVASVVAVVPVMVFAFGEPGVLVESATQASRSLVALALALGLALATALLIRPLPFPNPWLVGPIFLGAALSGSGMLIVAVPELLIVLAQWLIGISLGCRFKRALLFRLPRVVAAALAVSAYMIMASAGAAWIMAALSGLPYVTSFLALAPAAVTEMVITAKVMNLDAEVVAAFHVMRIAVIASTILVTFTLFERLARRLRGAFG
ncbi:ammonia monooxygenase [Halomonas sp. 1513]|nr:ammonia monooxygenase [Halomonas sp. 1513]